MNLKAQKAASTTEYALVVSLLAVVSIGVLHFAGYSVFRVFKCSAEDKSPDCLGEGGAGDCTDPADPFCSTEPEPGASGSPGGGFGSTALDFPEKKLVIYTDQYQHFPG